MFDRFIAFQAKLRPNATAVVLATGDIDFATFDRHIDSIAVGLSAIEQRPGEAIGIDIADPYRRWLTILALARRGIASGAPDDAGCRRRIGEARRTAANSETFEAPKSWFDEMIGRGSAPYSRAPVTPGDAGLVLGTSGTTGEAKRIGLSWRMLEAMVRNTPVAYGAAQNGRWLALTDQFTILRFALSLGGWATGNAVILLEEAVLDGALIDTLRPSLIGLVPHGLKMLLLGLPPGYRPRHAMRIVTGGSPLPVPLARFAEQRLSMDIRSVYGASECSAVTIADVAALERRPGAVGYVLPGVEIEVVDADERVQAFGEIGQIKIRSDRTVSGYLDDPARTAARFRDGWYYSGDIGYLLDDGLLVVEGRVEELMNLGGSKVAPGLVEDVVRGCPGIDDLAVYAVPDASGLDRCWMSIVTNAEFKQHILEARISESVPWVKVVFWRQVEVIPRNAMGKIQRNLLRDATSQFLKQGIDLAAMEARSHKP